MQAIPGTATVTAVTGVGVLRGAVLTSSGAAAGIQIYDGVAAAGTPILTLRGTVARTDSVMIPGEGLPFQAGLHVVVIGNAEFTIFRD